MNRITDYVLSAQLSTCIAALLTYVAHLLDTGAILNANWHWAIYPLLGLACLFMLIPHLIINSKDYRKEQS